MKSLLACALCAVTLAVGITAAQTIPNPTFESNLEGWYGMFDAWFPDNAGDLSWSSTEGGSARLYVSGAPSAIGMWAPTQTTIDSGQSVYTIVMHTDISGFGAIYLMLGGEPPYGQQAEAPDRAGVDTVRIVAERDYPAGTAVWVKMVVWPGSGEAFVYEVNTDSGVTDAGNDRQRSPQPAPEPHVFPSPFVNENELCYAVKTPAQVCLTITDRTGRVVRTVERGTRGVGTYSARWDGNDESGRRLAAGIYFWRLLVDGRLRTVKVVMMK